ncbi:MAG TPA: MFS transporter [Flavipsychrobacter sp.]|nr:MFS transporter [Flavipsychrobacter sp.]
MFLKKADIAIMALCTGLIVANLYYCQPLIILIAKDFGIKPDIAASLNYITQIGYAAGIFFIIPIGDLIERKKHILFTTAIVIISLAAAALSPSFLVLQIASFCIGFSTVVPQLILPLAAHLADPERRGKVIGSIMSGLLLGILLSRTVSGLLGAWLGWRAVFWVAAAICVLLLFIMAIRFPQSKPNFKGNWGQLMKSLIKLLPQPVLQEACILNALSFATFGAFWTTMVLYMAGGPFYLSSGQIGLFGLAGAAGASAAPIAGRLGDKRNPRDTIAIGLAMNLISFIVFYFTRNSIIGIIAGVILLDFGIQSVHVSNQTRVYALIPEARNRLNTIYMTITFIGTALGSAFGLWLWNLNRWPAFCLGGVALMVAAFGVYALYHKKLNAATIEIS